MCNSAGSQNTATVSPEWKQTTKLGTDCAGEICCKASCIFSNSAVNTQHNISTDNNKNDTLYVVGKCSAAKHFFLNLTFYIFFLQLLSSFSFYKYKVVIDVWSRTTPQHKFLRNETQQNKKQNNSLNVLETCSWMPRGISHLNLELTIVGNLLQEKGRRTVSQSPKHRVRDLSSRGCRSAVTQLTSAGRIGIYRQ